jgi:hypothetical protein
MRPQTLISLVLVLGIVLAPAIASSQPDPDRLMQGHIRWNTGVAAAGLRLRLMQGQDERAVTYTNQQGAFGFYQVPGKPSDYSLMITLGHIVVKIYEPQELQSIPRGGRLDVELRR